MLFGARSHLNGVVTKWENICVFSYAHKEKKTVFSPFTGEPSFDGSTRNITGLIIRIRKETKSANNRIFRLLFSSFFLNEHFFLVALFVSVCTRHFKDSNKCKTLNLSLTKMIKYVSVWACVRTTPNHLRVDVGGRKKKAYMNKERRLFVSYLL